MARYVKVSEARAQLTKLMVLAENELEWVILTRHGKPVASLVSHAQMMRIFDDENIDLFGPINPETGRQMGAAWVKRTGWMRGEDGPVEMEAQGDEDVRWRWWDWRKKTRIPKPVSRQEDQRRHELRELNTQRDELR